MDQAAPLTELLDRLRRDRPWIVTAYSGYVLDHLASDRPPGSAALVERLDVLIDGLYVESLHAALRWRGSSNQRIHLLSGRVAIADDEPGGIALHIDDDGNVEFIGVPPTPAFLRDVAAAMTGTGTPLQIDRRRCFPFPVRRGA